MPMPPPAPMQYPPTPYPPMNRMQYPQTPYGIVPPGMPPMPPPPPMLYPPAPYPPMNRMPPMAPMQPLQAGYGTMPPPPMPMYKQTGFAPPNATSARSSTAPLTLNKTLKVLDISMTMVSLSGVQFLFKSCPSLCTLFAVECNNMPSPTITPPKGTVSN